MSLGAVTVEVFLQTTGRRAVTRTESQPWAPKICTKLTLTQTQLSPSKCLQTSWKRHVWCHILGALGEVIFKLQWGKRRTVTNLSGGGDRKDFTKEVVPNASVARRETGATNYNTLLSLWSWIAVDSSV